MYSLNELKKGLTNMNVTTFDFNGSKTTPMCDMTTTVWSIQHVQWNANYFIQLSKYELNILYFLISCNNMFCQSSSTFDNPSVDISRKLRKHIFHDKGPRGTKLNAFHFNNPQQPNMVLTHMMQEGEDFNSQTRALMQCEANVLGR